MIYDINFLQNLTFEKTQTPLRRYLHKFFNHRKEIKKLKAHEKDFLFQNMSILRNENNELCFDLASIIEASDYYFNKLVLTYSENLDFNKQTINDFGEIIDNLTMEKDKDYFNNYFLEWQEQLKTKKGKYLNIINTELSKRLKGLDLELSEGDIDEVEYNYQIKYIYTIAFFIYYKVKLFFDGLVEKYILVDVAGEKILINIYSFVHILFRHYFPSMRSRNDKRSLNDPLPFLDINKFPDSARELLITYFNKDKTKLSPSREYLLFSFKNDKYIIWLKYDVLEELGGEKGFEFRSLYKCEEERDLNKFIGLTEHSINSDLSFYF